MPHRAPQPRQPGAGLRARCLRWVRQLADVVMALLVGPVPRCPRCGLEMRLLWERVSYHDPWTVEGTRHWACPRCGAHRCEPFVQIIERVV